MFNVYDYERKPMETDTKALRKKLMDNIILRLGGGMIDVELDSDTLNHCIDLAIMQLKQRGDACYEQDLVILTLRKNVKEYILPDEIIYVQQIFRKGFGRFYGSYSGSQMDPFAYAWSNIYSANLFAAGGAGGLVTYDLGNQYLKTVGRMFGLYMNYTYDEFSHKLTLAENPRVDDEVIGLGAVVLRPEYAVLQDRMVGIWIENWALAEAKEMLGQMRDRFQSLPGALGSVTQNGSALKSEAKEAKAELIKQLDEGVGMRDFAITGNMPFLG